VDRLPGTCSFEHAVSCIAVVPPSQKRERREPRAIEDTEKPNVLILQDLRCPVCPRGGTSKDITAARGS
jgi:hypothetical protein